jgi:FkbM family methyltransferase
MSAINIGANVGYAALVMSRAVGDAGLVIAIEPEPLNFRLLWENLSRNGVTNVLPIHAAAGEHTGTTVLGYSPDNSGDHRTARHPVAVASLDVPLVAVDDLIEDQRVDLVVCDAQGFDHRIVAGMQRLIERCRPPLLVEFWPPGIMELGDRPVEVVEFYRSLGYRITVLTTGQEVSGADPQDVVDIALTNRDHVSLALE